MSAMVDARTVADVGHAAVTVGSEAKGLSVYSAEALACVQAYGRIIARSGLFGTRVEEQGQTIVLMSMSDGVPITRYREKFHVMGAQLALRAEWMLAEFRRLGGKYRWIDQGDDGQQAVIEATFAGESATVKFSIEDAKKMNLVKKDSGWEKNPGSMLRARVQSKMVRMLAPEVVAGYYTEEELQGIENVDAIGASLTVGCMPTATLQPNFVESHPIKISQVSAPTVDHTVTSTIMLATAEQLAEFDALITELGVSSEKQQANLAAAGVDRPAELSTEKIAEFISILRAKKASLSPSSVSETGSHRLDLNGPLSKELDEKIRTTIKEVAQTPGGAEITKRLREHLDKSNRKLGELTHAEALKLLAALEQRQVELFLSVALNDQKKE